MSRHPLTRGLAAVAVGASMALLPTGIAQARITAEPVSCETPGGSQPTGQQPECKGKSSQLEQETENRNPAGKAPAGQNK